VNKILYEKSNNLNSIGINSISSQIKHENSDWSIDVRVPFASFFVQTKFAIWMRKIRAVVKILHVFEYISL